MTMTYLDSAEDIRITWTRVDRELVLHGVSDKDRDAFASEVLPGPDGLWDAVAVLEWLGY